MIDPIGALDTAVSSLQALAGAIAPSRGEAAPAAGIAAGTGAASGSFAHTLQQALGQLDNSVSSSDAAARSFASGNHDIPLSDVMISLEQANLAMQLASIVRDKVVAAYSSIMNMQI